MPLLEITEENLEEAFQYHQWTSDQTTRGNAVRGALVDACKVIFASVPRCPLRTRALNAIFDARMQCNAAITHEEMK